MTFFKGVEVLGEDITRNKDVKGKNAEPVFHSAVLFVFPLPPPKGNYIQQYSKQMRTKSKSANKAKKTHVKATKKKKPIIKTKPKKEKLFIGGILDI